MSTSGQTHVPLTSFAQVTGQLMNRAVSQGGWRWEASAGGRAPRVADGRHMPYASACRYIFKNLQLEVVRVLLLGIKSLLYSSLDILNRVTLVQCEIKLL